VTTAFEAHRLKDRGQTFKSQQNDPNFATKDSFKRMEAGNAAVLELFELYPEAVDNHFSRAAA
jgi:hypothetical protein